eukprot:838685-Amphidinium_carterae.1
MPCKEPCEESQATVASACTSSVRGKKRKARKALADAAALNEQIGLGESAGSSAKYPSQEPAHRQAYARFQRFYQNSKRCPAVLRSEDKTELFERWRECRTDAEFVQ